MTLVRAAKREQHCRAPLTPLAISEERSLAGRTRSSHGASVSARRVVRGARGTDVMVKGTLLAESLRIGAVLQVDALTVSRIFRRDVAATATSAQPGVWTFVEFEGPDEIADTLARSLAETLLREGSWYADFTVENDHVVVFADRVFRYEPVSYTHLTLPTIYSV